MLKLYNVSINNLPDVAVKICSYYPTHKIFCFVGEMGAGKTTLIKEICNYLGVKENSSSPTYSIVNEYLDGHEKTIYHFDLYRINNIKELFDIGFEEYLFSGNLCLIEWPKIADHLFEEYIEITMEKTDENVRKIKLEIKKVN